MTPAFAVFDRREILKIGRHLARAIGHIDMEGIDIDRIALPRHHLAAGMDDKPGEFVDRAAGLSGCPAASGDRAGSADRISRPE